MIDSFMTVLVQVLVLFVLIAVGFVSAKTKIINENGAKVIADVVLYFVTPCVIIDAFQREFDADMLIKLLVSASVSAVILFVSVLIAQLLFRKQDKDKTPIYKFATVFSNCGYMSLPLQQALLKEEGVFYAASFIAMFNIFVWSYGIITMSPKDNKKVSMKILINPGIIGTVIGVVLFVSSITLPKVVAAPVDYMAAMNSPLPMLIIGYYLANANLKKAFTDVYAYISMGLRLVVLPLLSLAVLYFCGVRGVLLVSLIISVSSPVAAITTMMSAKYGHDTELSVSIVSASTLLSLVTMPLIVGLAQYIS